MGRFDFDAVQPNAERPLPAGHRDFAVRRAAYQRSLSDVRRSFAGEWTARRAREEVAISAFQKDVRTASAAAVAAKRERSAASEATHAARVARLREARTVRRALSRRAYGMTLEAVAERRKAWLDALEADAAANWVTEDRIDEVRCAVCACVNGVTSATVHSRALRRPLDRALFAPHPCTRADDHARPLRDEVRVAVLAVVRGEGAQEIASGGREVRGTRYPGPSLFSSAPCCGSLHR